MSGAHEGLYRLAEPFGLRIGTCVSAQPLVTDARYAEIVRREFNLLTTENALKFATLRSSRSSFDFADADAVLEFAEAHGMAVRGHVLLWNAQLPQWLLAGDYDATRLTDIMVEHIATVVGRYAGRIDEWDVVNEAIADDGSYRDSLWHRTIGRSYIDLAFRAAREADPDALLVYNDYGIERTTKHAAATHALLRDLVRRNVPVDGVGLQMHLQVAHRDQTHELVPAMERLADLGLTVNITELDVRMKLDGPPTPGQLDAQAEVYRSVLQACLEAPRCRALVLWGVSDRYSWIPHFYPDEGAALVFDDEYRPKPGYLAIEAELRARRESLPSPPPSPRSLPRT